MSGEQLQTTSGTHGSESIETNNNNEETAKQQSITGKQKQQEHLKQLMEALNGDEEENGEEEYRAKVLQQKQESAKRHENALNKPKEKQEEHINQLLEEMEKIEDKRASMSTEPKEVVEEIIKREYVHSLHETQTQISGSSSSTYPDVFPSSPESPLHVQAIPYPKPSQSVDSPLPRSTMSSFKPSISSSRPESLELPPPPTPQELETIVGNREEIQKASTSPISPGAFSYTQGMFPKVMGSPKGHRGHRGHSPSHEEVFPKMGYSISSPER